MPGSERVPDGWPGWPDGKKFAFVLTHDVERQVGLDKCRALLRLEQELGFRSSFNFVPEGSYKVPAQLREELVRNGFEVGVHDLKHDGRLYRSRHEFRERAVRINRYLAEWGAVGFRSAFMLRKLDWLHELGISYDASTFDTDPFEPQPEGCQTIFPFWVSAPVAEKSKVSAPEADQKSDRTSDLQSAIFGAPRSGYVELPYTLPQDSTLFLLLCERTTDIWRRKLDWIAEHGGMALIDTHPDYMALNGSSQRTGEYPIELYKELLDYIRSMYSGEYWPALPRQVAAYVLQSMALSQNQTQVGQIGPGFYSPGEKSDNGFESAPCTVGLLASPVKEGSAVSSYAAAGLGNRWRLRGKRGAVLLFSYYPADPRPRRAAEALAMEGVTVDLICLRENDREPAYETINGVNVFRVQRRRHRGTKRRYVGQYAAFILTSLTRLTFRSLTRRYDFVHVHNMPDVLVFSALVPKVLGAKIILDLHDPMPELMQAIFELPAESVSVRFMKQLEKRSIGFADSVLTVSRTFKNIFSSRSCPPDKIKVVLNSPDDRIFRFQAPGTCHSNGEKPSRPFVILYHGSLLRRNGFDLAVDALETARKSLPAARLVVCGAPTAFFEKVMESVHERGLDESVDYLGARNLEQIVMAINGCDVGVVPNHRNVFTELNTPTRIFECLALGKPVIAPRARGIQDYFGDEDLIYFELGDADDLAEKIKYAYFHPSEVEQIVKRGQQIYLTHTWSSEKSKLLNAFAELL